MRLPPPKNIALFALAATAALASLATGAYAIPALILFLCLIPGYCALKLAGVRLEPVPFAVACVVLSYLASAHAVYWVSLAIGYSSLSVALAFLALAVPLLFVKVEPDGLTKAVREHERALAAAAFVFLFVSTIGSISFWKLTDAGMVSGGWNWSDFGFHLSIIQSLNAGNFPPQAPFAAGAPLTYHWFADFLTAISSRLTGVFPGSIAPYEAASYAALAFMGAYALALQCGAKRDAAVLAAVLLLLGGGLGWLKLVDMLNAQPLPDLIAQHSFDNSWEADWGPYRIPSVLGTTILTWRASAAAFPAFILALLLLLRKDYLLAGVVVGLIGPFNFFSFAAAVACAAFFFLWDAIAALRTRIAGDSGAFAGFARWAWFLPPLLLAAPFVVQGAGANAPVFKFKLGWEAPTTSLEAFAGFYLLNLGLPLLLALAGFALGKFEEKGKLLFAAAALFAIPNLVNLTSVEWDMCKFFGLMSVALCVPAGVMLERVPRLPWLPVLFLCCLSPLLVSLWMVSGNQLAYDNNQLAAAAWMEENTTGNAVFATQAFINQAPDIAGRKRILTFQPYVTNSGISTKQRDADLHSIYCGTESESVAALLKYAPADAAYVMSGYSEPGCAYPYENSTRFENVFESGYVKIWKLKAP